MSPRARPACPTAALAPRARCSARYAMRGTRKSSDLQNGSKSLRRWGWIHKWTSLICTAFLLMLCITGLPLIFHEEIEELEGKPHLAKQFPAGTPVASMDKLAENALAKYPTKVIRYIYWDEHEPNTTAFSLSDSINAAPENYTTVIMDDHTA